MLYVRGDGVILVGRFILLSQALTVPGVTTAKRIDARA